MIVTRDDVFTVVCEILTPTGHNNSKVGTGMFVTSTNGKGESRGWIVTASHVAKETSDNTIIVIQAKDGKAQELPLPLFGPVSTWRHHEVADISAFPVLFSPINRQFTHERFYPIDHVMLEKRTVSRDFELTCVGFPHGLGTSGMFSPFTFRSYASSSYVTLNRADTRTECDFFCLENPSVGGYSGCPVFDLGYSFDGLVRKTKEQTWCIGFMHGTMSDNTGGKIAMVTPAYYLADLVRFD